MIEYQIWRLDTLVSDWKIDTGLDLDRYQLFKIKSEVYLKNF